VLGAERTERKGIQSEHSSGKLAYRCYDRNVNGLPNAQCPEGGALEEVAFVLRPEV